MYALVDDIVVNKENKKHNEREENKEEEEEEEKEEDKEDFRDKLWRRRTVLNCCQIGYARINFRVKLVDENGHGYIVTFYWMQVNKNKDILKILFK